MSRIRLYCGLAKEGMFLNHTEVNPLTGGVLAMLDGPDKSGAARLLNLLRGSIKSVFTEDGKEYELRDEDYLGIRIVDTWKVGYEQIKIAVGDDYPVFPENFYCDRCSMPGLDRYTDVKESWAKLVEEGLIDEIYAETGDCEYKVKLPEPIVIEPSGVTKGGKFDTLIRRPLTIKDMLSIQKNALAMSTEANMIYATWDATIVGVEGMNDRDFNVVVKRAKNFFTKTHVSSSANVDAMEQAEEANILGMDAKDRQVKCKYCGNEIGGYLDFTNFFSPLLPKRSGRVSTPKTRT